VKHKTLTISILNTAIERQ